MGRTLTVDANLGTVVVAILTIFTSIGTAQLFHLLTFLYHQFRASGQPADGLFWQQQALLRTLPPPTGVVADYIKLWWSWRAKANRGAYYIIHQHSTSLSISNPCTNSPLEIMAPRIGCSSLRCCGNSSRYLFVLYCRHVKSRSPCRQSLMSYAQYYEHGKHSRRSYDI